MRITGIDLSTTNTGVALVEHGEMVKVLNVKTDAKDWEATYSGRFNRLQRTVRSITGYAYGADLVVIEGPSYGSKTAGTWDRAGLFWTVYGVLASSGRPIAIVPPNVRAKWATGKGNVSKTNVAVACGRLFPDIAIVDDNAADAMVLAAMGAQWLQEPACTVYAYMIDALTHAEWPTL